MTPANVLRVVHRPVGDSPGIGCRLPMSKKYTLAKRWNCSKSIFGQQKSASKFYTGVFFFCANPYKKQNRTSPRCAGEGPGYVATYTPQQSFFGLQVGAPSGVEESTVEAKCHEKNVTKLLLRKGKFEEKRVHGYRNRVRHSGFVVVTVRLGNQILSPRMEGPHGRDVVLGIVSLDVCAFQVRHGW